MIAAAVRKIMPKSKVHHGEQGRDVELHLLQGCILWPFPHRSYHQDNQHQY